MKKKIGLMMLIIMAIATLMNVSITFAATTVCDHDYDFPYYCSICQKYYGPATCSKCGKSYTRTDTCSQHTCSYSYDYSVSATCTSQGYTVYSCSCGDSYKSYTSALGHNYATQSTTSTYLKTAATCTSPAVYYYKCSRCTSSSSTLTTPTTYTSGSALGHTESAWVQTTTTHKQTCTVCSTVLVDAEHADGDGDGSCDTCGYSMLPVPTITLSLSVIRTAPSNTMGYHYQYTGDGEVTVTVGSSSIAIASIDTTNSNIIVTGVSDGETTLTLSAPATSNYAATTATITIKVATPLLKEEEYNESLWSDYIFGNSNITQRRKDIDKISIETIIPTVLPSGAFDVSKEDNGSVYAWLTTTDSEIVLHIAGSGGVTVSSGAYLFSRYKNCTQISGLSNLNTTGVTNMRSMFQQCEKLQALEFDENFDTSCVTDMLGMFGECRTLTELDISNFDTTNLTSMQTMFCDCSALTNINLEGLNTTNVTSMAYMFWGCSSLISLDLSSVDTSNVINMCRMFSECTGLTSIPTGLDLSNTNITSNTSTSSGFARMFYGCSSLTSARINSKYIGYQMFYGCNNLTNITIASDVQGVYANSDCFKYTGSGTLETKVLSFSSAMTDYEWTTDNRSLVTPDTLAPLGTISLGSAYVEVNGYMYVNSNTVTINLTASDDVTAISDIEVALINEDNYDKTKSNSSIVWQGFSPSVQWTTSSGGGLKYVYVIFKDEAGNQSVYFAS